MRPRTRARAPRGPHRLSAIQLDAHADAGRRAARVVSVLDARGVTVEGTAIVPGAGSKTAIALARPAR